MKAVDLVVQEAEAIGPSEPCVDEGGGQGSGRQRETGRREIPGAVVHKHKARTPETEESLQ